MSTVNIGAVPLDLFLKAPLWEIAWIGLALGFDHFHVCGYTAKTEENSSR